MKNFFCTYILLILLSLNDTSVLRDTPLLKIARSIDKNEVHYFINEDNKGNLDKKEPIILFWKNHKKNGQYEELNWIKKKYGYGVKCVSSKSNEVCFQFVSYKKRNFYLKKNGQDRYIITSFFDEKEIELDQIFVNIDGGSFWAPNVTTVEMRGRFIGDDKPFYTSFKP
jgi:hypothetical protein